MHFQLQQIIIYRLKIAGRRMPEFIHWWVSEGPSYIQFYWLLLWTSRLFLVYIIALGWSEELYSDRFMDSEVIHVNLYKYIVFQPKHELKMVKFNQIILIALKLLPFVCLRGSLPKHSQLCEGSIYTANVCNHWFIIRFWWKRLW